MLAGSRGTERRPAPQHVFIIGAKGLGNYGGYETFVNRLTEMHQNQTNLQYHVACKANGSGAMDEKKLPQGQVTELGSGRFRYHNADCFKIRVPERLRSAQALYYDITALRRSIAWCRHYAIEHPVFYVLACRIGPWIGGFARRIHEIGGALYVNPDGHEWKRAKWSRPVRHYWKLSERLMVRHADLLICDSLNIEAYIHKEYAAYSPKTVYIAYGADVKPCGMADDDPVFTGWMRKQGLKSGRYYLIVGRFVPENNFETMIREFMKSHSERDLAIVTTRDDAFLNRLDGKLHWSEDPRIKFVGTVYNQELLKKIRENAYGYLHGHSVGGTNPSLLEALGSTKLNLLYGVGFNREVGRDAAVYWSKREGDLASLIDRADRISTALRDEYGAKAKARVRSAYSWKFIAGEYEKLFLNRPAKG